MEWFLFVCLIISLWYQVIVCHKHSSYGFAPSICVRFICDSWDEPLHLLLFGLKSYPFIQIWLKDDAGGSNEFATASHLYCSTQGFGCKKQLALNYLHIPRIFDVDLCLAWAETLNFTLKWDVYFNLGRSYICDELRPYWTVNSI